jgi:hypothetical protein
MSNKDLSKLSLAERDLLIKKIEEEIKNKKQLLIDETKSIETGKKTNKLLEGVYTNYKAYYDNTVNEKQQQYDAMMLLKEYLDDLIKKEKMTTREVKNMKRDQHNIILEMETITRELKEITK